MPFFEFFELIIAQMFEFNGFNFKSLRYSIVSQRLFRESFRMVSASCSNLTGLSLKPHKDSFERVLVQCSNLTSFILDLSVMAQRSQRLFRVYF